MFNNTSSIKIFVFIARDDKEYKKYELEKGDNEEHGKEHNGFQWRFNASDKLLRLIINKRSIDGAWNHLRPADNATDLKDNERLAVVLETLRKYEKSMLEESRNLENFKKNETEGDAVSHVISKIETEIKKISMKIVNAKTDMISIVEKVFVDTQQDDDWRGALWLFLKGLKDGDDKPILAREEKDIQGRIFIHWGGGEKLQMLFYERKVSELLPQNWRLYSLGTYRNDLFLVDGDTIKVPCDLKELQKLERKFSGEVGFEGVRDVMTKYVVGNAKYQQKINQSGYRVNVFNFTERQSVDCLKKYLEFIKYVKENPLAVKLIDQSKTLQDCLQGEKVELPYCEEIVALFSLLVREGIYHG